MSLKKANPSRHQPSNIFRPADADGAQTSLRAVGCFRSVSNIAAAILRQPLAYSPYIHHIHHIHHTHRSAFAALRAVMHSAFLRIRLHRQIFHFALICINSQIAMTWQFSMLNQITNRVSILTT